MSDNSMIKLSGDRLLLVMAALANPHRLRIMAKLSTGGRNYVSQLAREVDISRPLIHLHLNKLLEAGLVTSTLEFSDDSKALNYFDVSPFSFVLSPETLVGASETLTFNPN